MNRWKKPAMAAALALLILAGTWGGLLVEQRSAQTMGRTEQALPRIRLEQDGGIKLTLGPKEWRAEPERVRGTFSALGKAEWALPRSLRMTGLAALSGLWWAEQELGYPMGKKLLVGLPAPLEAKGDEKEKV